jgi:hypothetical protein
MVPNKVLLVGMLDSIHVARWLHQFIDQEIEFVISPSKKFRKIHPEIKKLLNSKNIAKFSLVKPYISNGMLGFIDYGISSSLKLFKVNWRTFLLKKALSDNSFKYAHALEIQGAGYLFALIPTQKLNDLKLIVTNYGNDIYYFQNFPGHLKKIKKILSMANLYSAECSRDYELALKYGFEGNFLPLIPNSGGIVDNVFSLNKIPSNERNMIIAKCYGGELGLGHLIIESLSDFLATNLTAEVLIHSVTDDLIRECNFLQMKYSNRVKVYTVRNKIPRSDLIEHISKSRVYIGACKSDGISTSFLEAICLGAYPIQTNTSCAGDWINLGFKGEIVEPDKNSIFLALNNAYLNPELENFRQINLRKGKEYLNYNKIKNEALKFYGLN